MINTLTKNTAKNSLHELEIKLLLACSRTKISAELKTKIQSLVRQKVDWQYFIELAARHQLVSLVYHNLAEVCPDSVPSEYLAVMRQLYSRNTQKNLFVTRELIRIYRLFQQHQISVIPFKGMTLAMTAYKNLTFRDSCDIDLLISKKNFPLATELLLSLEYEKKEYTTNAKDSEVLRQSLFLQSETRQKGYNFINHKKKLAIDLQWSLTEKALSRYFNLSFEQLEQNAGDVMLADTQLAQFAPETMVLYLCFHGSKHCWQSLKWICDLAEFINNHPELDWQAIARQARELKLTTMLHLGLLLAHNFYQTEIPQPLAIAVKRNTRAFSLFEQVREIIFLRLFTQWEDYVFIFKITDSWLGKLQFLTGLLFTPTTKEWDVVKLPQALFPLYYLIRPYRLTKELLIKQRQFNISG